MGHGGGGDARFPTTPACERGGDCLLSGSGGGPAFSIPPFPSSPRHTTPTPNSRTTALQGSPPRGRVGRTLRRKTPAPGAGAPFGGWNALGSGRGSTDSPRGGGGGSRCLVPAPQAPSSLRPLPPRLPQPRTVPPGQWVPEQQRRMDPHARGPPEGGGGGWAHGGSRRRRDPSSSRPGGCGRGWVRGGGIGSPVGCSAAPSRGEWVRRRVPFENPGHNAPNVEERENKAIQEHTREVQPSRTLPPPGG